MEHWIQALGDTGREFEAVKRSLENAGVLSQNYLDTFRRWVSTLSKEQLQSVLSAAPLETLAATVVSVHLAELLVATGNTEEAKRIVSEVLERSPLGPERERAELLVSVVADPLAKPVKLGAILPLTGELADVGEWLREGIELAVEDYERSHRDGFDLELTRTVADSVSIPVIASGGAGKLNDISSVIVNGHADAVAIASMLHYSGIEQFALEDSDYEQEGNIEHLRSRRGFSLVDESSIGKIKEHMVNNGIDCRNENMTQIYD